MSLLWMSRVFAAPAPVGTDRVMLLALADNANDEGFCWPGVGTLRRKCGLATERGTRKVLDRLVEWSASAPAESVVLSVRHRDGQSNIYTLALSGRTAIAEPADRGVPPDRGERVERSKPVPQDRGGDVPLDRSVTVQADRGGLSSGTAEPSENPNQNPHHNHQGGDGTLRLVRPPAGVVVVGDGWNEGMPEAARSEPGALSQSIEALIDRGVTEPVAVRLATDFAGRIDAALAAFDRSGQYGPGWLVRAVEAGWADEKPAPHASHEQGAARPPQGAYGPVAEPRRMQAQAVLWLEQQGHPASALTEFFEPAGTWVMDPDRPPVPMYRLRASAAQAGALG